MEHADDLLIQPQNRELVDVALGHAMQGVDHGLPGIGHDESRVGGHDVARDPVGPRRAIEQPRVHLDGAELHCEAGTDEGVMEELEALGYPLVRWPGRRRNLFFGGVAAVGVGPGGTLQAAGDSRRGGHGVVVA